MIVWCPMRTPQCVAKVTPRHLADAAAPLCNTCHLFDLLRSPSIMGILVADRRYLGEIGVLDGGMKVYGGENVELGIRVSIPQEYPRFAYKDIL